MSQERRRPSKLLRWLFRLPVGIYRARLGWIFGRRFLMLTHRGRKSGLVRRTVVEVVAHSGSTYVVFSGYGATADWYRNALASPPLRVDVGSEHFEPAVRDIPEPERRQLLAEYAVKHPTAAKALGDRMFGVAFTGDSASLGELARRLPALEFSPRQG
jgi:deazaflavin-dependent oxidoreductase (nitroreductase family)